MKKLTTLILMGLVCGTVWGQTNSANNENITGEWTFSGDRFYRDVQSSKQMSNIIKVDGVNKWLWRKLANSLDLRLYSYGVLKDILTLQYGTGNIAIGNSSNYTDVRLTTQSQNANSTAFRSIGKIDVWGNKLDAGDVLATIRGFNYSVNRDAYLLKVGVAGASNWEKFVIKGNGNVGIGLINPTEKLTLNSGNIQVQNADDQGLKLLQGDVRRFGKIVLKKDGGTGVGTPNTLLIEAGNEYGAQYGQRILFRTANSDRLVIEHDGKIGIGTTTPSAKLDVAGNIKAQEIEVTLASINDMQLNGTLAANNITYTTNGNTADFVFEENYQLKDLTEVEAFIKANKHLPEIPSAAEMEEAGVNLAEMNKLLLMKVEELTLYSIEQEMKIEMLTEDRRRETEENNEKVMSLEFKVEELSDERRAIRGEMEELRKMVLELVKTPNP